MSEDAINRPSHYAPKHVGGSECVQVVQEMPYNVGTAMAYLWRCDRKHDTPVEDLLKARKHIDFELQRLGHSSQQSTGQAQFDLADERRHAVLAEE